jgi:hypothetical protein
VTTKELIEEVASLPVEEEAEIESPDWHRDVLEERKQEIESGKAEFISLHNLRAAKKS